MTSLARLKVSYLRNLDQVSIALSPSLNIFYGDNGSGKTSLLEAISLLGLGRSFRSHKTRSLINHDQSELVVFAELLATHQASPIPLGVQRQRSGNTVIRCSGETVKTAAVLARQLPLQIINADSFQLIEGAPSQRRQFLDWLVFHVKPEFIVAWKSLQKVLKHRNSLLRRDKIAYSEFSHWDKEFTRLAHEIHAMRQDVFNELNEAFLELSTEFLGQQTIAISYSAGWDIDQALADILEQGFERDRRDGYTHVGPQRANLKFTAAGKPAADVLSRGQEKALVCVLHIAQAKLYRQQMHQQCVFLVDDLPAELDSQHRELLAKWLTALDGQVFVTGVHQQDLLAAWRDYQDIDLALFHVKQGLVTQVPLDKAED